MNKQSFNGRRLQFARKRRGQTARELSSSLGVTSRTLSSYENGQQVPDHNAVGDFARLLGFPVPFFYMEDISPLSADCVSFRSLARMSARVRDMALCAGQIALELCDWLDAHFKLPASTLPAWPDHTPEAAADALRVQWNMGTGPVKNIIHLLESKGVRVFSLDEHTEDMDGFSFWQGDTPFIFLNTRKSMERSRFDAAHELGHLILHRHVDSKGKKVEAEANRFAATFLMPESGIEMHRGKFISMNWVYQAKAHWRVSASALIRRFFDLGVLSEWHYRTMVIELSKNGYARKEPHPIREREFSKLFPMIFKALKEEGKDRYYLSTILNVYPQELDTLLFNLTLIGVYGGGKARPHDSPRPPLRLVTG